MSEIKANVEELEELNFKKRDGRISDFEPSKIANSIYKAAHDTAYETQKEFKVEDADKIVKFVIDTINKNYANGLPTAKDLDEVVLDMLNENNFQNAANSYKSFSDKRRKEREANTELMKEIHDITHMSAEENDDKRENANVDGNTSMGTMLQYGATVSKKFALTKKLAKEHAQAHIDGDVHIHDMDFLSIGTLTCCQIDLLKLFKDGFSTGNGFLREPGDIMSYAALAAIAVQSNQNEQHGGQSIPTLDYGLAPGVKKTYRKLFIQNIAKAFEMFSTVEMEKALEIAKLVVSKDITMSEEGMKDAVDTAVIKSSLDLSDEEVIKVISFAQKHALKETDRKTYQAMEAFIHNLNTMHSRAGAQVPFSSVNLGTDTTDEGRMVTKNLLLATEAGLGHGETAIFPILIFKVKEGINFNKEDRNYDLFQLGCRVSAKRLFPNFSFIDAPFNIKYYQEGRPETEATYMGCRTRVVGNSYDKNNEIVTGRGNLSFSSINLPRLGIKHGIVSNEQTNLDNFFGELDQKIDMLMEQLLQRFELQKKKKVKNFPFLMGQGIWHGSDNLTSEDTVEEVIKHGTLTVGFIGLGECLKALIGKHHGESKEAQELGLKIITHMRTRLDNAAEATQLNFSLIATPAEGLSGRFTRIDKKKYGVIEGVTDREYYTNSFHVPVYARVSAFNKINLEAPYHELTNAGHISYVELDGDPVKNLEAFEAVVRAMKEAGIGYGSINHPVDRDPVCGYNGVIHNECPKCGRTEEDGIKFDRIRRITGYLVGTVDRFNNGKQAEERDRVKHSLSNEN